MNNRLKAYFYRLPLLLPIIFIVCSGVQSASGLTDSPLSIFKKPAPLQIAFLDGTIKSYTIAGFYDPRVETLDATSVETQVMEPFLKVSTERGILLLKLARVYYLSSVEPQTISIVSDDQVKCYSLGSMPSANLPPPDWFRFGGETPQWQTVALAHPNYNWFYIPGAAWVWSNTNLVDTAGETVLFRHNFNLPQNFRVVNAELIATADHRFEKIYLNEQQLPQPQDVPSVKIVRYDITSLIKSENNLLAVKAVNERRRGINFAGVAWRINLYGYQSEKEQNINQFRPGVVIFLLNDDKISGELQSLNSDKIVISTPYDRLAINLLWIEKILLNYEQNESSADSKANRRRITFTKLFSRGKLVGASSERPHRQPVFWIIDEQEDVPVDFVGLKLKSGELIKDRLVGYSKEGIEVVTDLGTQVTVPLHQIHAIYPVSRQNKGYLRFNERDFPYVVEVSCGNGDKINGVVDKIEAGYLQVTTPYCDTIKVPYTQLFKCTFPLNTKLETIANLKQWTKARNRTFTVALMGDAIGTTPQRTREAQNFYNELNRALEDLRVNVILASPIKLIEPNVLTPETVDLLINFDARDHYYHTVKETNDGYQAIMNYLNGGGNFLSVAAGTPFYYGFIPGRRQWQTISSGEKIMAALGFDVILPGEFCPQAQAFELPENNKTGLFFHLIEFNNQTSTDSLEIKLSNLPQQLEFPPSADSRFRPVIQGNVQSDDRFLPVYKLVDSNGRDYGPALAIIKRKLPTGKSQLCTYVSYQLARATLNGQTFLDFFLPVLFEAIIENY